MEHRAREQNFEFDAEGAIGAQFQRSEGTLGAQFGRAEGTLGEQFRRTNGMSENNLDVPKVF